MFRRFSWILAFIALSSCTTSKGGYTKASEVERRLIGMTDTEVVSVLGAPENEVQLSRGRSWTYRDEVKTLSGGECRISVTLQGGKVVAATVNHNDLSPVSFPLGACQKILRNLD